MVNFIKDYVSRLSIDDIDTFAQKNNICLDNEEIEFIYNFIKKNYEALLINPDIDLSRYRIYFKNDNFEKISTLLNEYKKKYAKFLS